MTVAWLARRCFGAIAALTTLAQATPAWAQGLPEAPISLAGGHVVIGAEAVATVAAEDPGFFNYTSYEYSALRNVRFGLSAEVRANDHVQLLGEVRIDQGRVLEAYGLYLRIRPWARKRFDLQVGRIPPTFGAMTRTSYGSGNLLIGQPLAYHYLLSIRPDAVPARPDDLLRMRGRGWLSNFPVGNRAPAPGLPIVNTARWDTGLQAHGVGGMFEWTGAISVGSLSDPRLRDNNGGRQLAGRLVARPSAAWVLGVSAAQGPWLNRALEDRAERRSRQSAIGGDAEYSVGPILIRGEAIRSAWTMPAIARPLVATSLLIEGRYKVAPGAYIAARADRLDFITIRGSVGSNTWDADTWRVELGGGYSIRRNLLAKGAWQRNHRDGGRVPRDTLVTAQVVYWF